MLLQDKCAYICRGLGNETRVFSVAMQKNQARSYEQCCATSLFVLHLLCAAGSTRERWPRLSRPLLLLERKGIRERDSVRLVNRQLLTFVRPISCNSDLHPECRRPVRRLAPLHT